MRTVVLYEIEVKGGKLFKDWVYYSYRENFQEARTVVATLKQLGCKGRIIEYSTERRVLR